MFGIGQKPTGDKDPFGLRRAALGVVRILVELDLPLDSMLWSDWRAAVSSRSGSPKASGRAAFGFVSTACRLLREPATRRSEIEAVLSLQPTRIDVVRAATGGGAGHSQALPEAESLAAANKRIGNILKQGRRPRASPFAAKPDCCRNRPSKRCYDALTQA